MAIFLNSSLLAANRDAPSHVERVGLSGTGHTVVSTDENRLRRRKVRENKGRGGETGKKQTWTTYSLGLRTLTVHSVATVWRNSVSLRRSASDDIQDRGLNRDETETERTG